MHYLTPLLAMLILAAAPTFAASVPLDAVTEYLLTSAATDFRTHGPKGELRFRTVRRAVLTLNVGEERQLLCGQFLVPAKPEEWTSFATVKTSGYEQWLGETTSFCQHPKTVIDNTRDLTSELQSRFDALK